MLRRSLICGLMLIAAGTSVGEEKSEAKKPAEHAQMAKMKKLVGTWVAADENGKPTDQVVSVIKLTAGGSAIHETLFPGGDMEMVSIYNLDGSDLVMTHYCMLGNQPRMKADPKSPANKITFNFTGGGNLDPNKDKHMHGATLTIVDADHIEVDGIGWEDGKPAKEMCGQMKVVRKK
jgi:hypothetical protein